MNPQSPRDPRAEKAAADPLVAIWAEYQVLDAAATEAGDAYSKAERAYLDGPHPVEGCPS